MKELVELVLAMDAKRTKGVWLADGGTVDCGAKADIFDLSNEDAEFISYAPEMAQLIKDLWEENQLLKADIKCYESDIEKHYKRERIYREALEVALSIAEENEEDPDTVLIVHLKQALNTEVK